MRGEGKEGNKMGDALGLVDLYLAGFRQVIYETGY